MNGDKPTTLYCVWCRSMYHFNRAVFGQTCNHCGRLLTKRAKKGRFSLKRD